MSIEGLIFAGFVCLISAIVIVLPLLSGRHAQNENEEQAQKQRERLLAYYERVLRNVRDLDEDHSTGKIADADYEVERESWVQRGIALLKALDELDAQHIPMLGDESALDKDIDERIEQAVAAYRERVRS